MLITQKRIRTLDAHIPDIHKGKLLRLRVSEIDRFGEQMQNAGFEQPLVIGNAVLPRKTMGSVSKFNTEGKFIPLKNQPKETHYRSQVWTRTEYRGKNNSIEVSSLVFVPYKRYPREEVMPTGIELILSKDGNGHLTITAEAILYSKETSQKLLIAINLFLEIFGECNIQTEDGDSVKLPPLVRMNWTLLPPGNTPWEKVLSTLRNSHGNKQPRNIAAIESRIKIINEFNPSQIAIGSQGFAGYAVFCFEKIGLYVMECQRIDNATYVMGEDWQKISRYTKAEILNGKLHQYRIIHGPQWKDEISKLLRKNNKNT